MVRAGKRSRHVTEQQRCVQTAVEELNLEVESRCEQIQRQSEALIFSLQCQVGRDLSKIPRNVRAMTLREFADKYGGDATAVTSEKAAALQDELESWVASTPRLRKRHSYMPGSGTTPLRERRRRGQPTPRAGGTAAAAAGDDDADAADDKPRRSKRAAVEPYDTPKARKRPTRATRNAAAAANNKENNQPEVGRLRRTRRGTSAAAQ